MSHSLTRSLSAVKQSQNKSDQFVWALKDQLEGAFAEDVPVRASEDKHEKLRDR